MTYSLKNCRFRVYREYNPQQTLLHFIENEISLIATTSLYFGDNNLFKISTALSPVYFWVSI